MKVIYKKPTLLNKKYKTELQDSMAPEKQFILDLQVCMMTLEFICKQNYLQ